MNCSIPILAASLLAPLAATAADSLPLASEGKPLQPIVISAKASEMTRAVAMELAEYLGRIASAKFAVQTGDGSQGIVLGTLADFPNALLAKPLEIRNKYDGREAFAIRTEPKRLFQTEAYGGMTSMTVVAGNFGFAMNGSHYFEAFRFLADEDLVEVSAWFSPEAVPNPRGAQFEDRAGCLRAVTRSGKRLYMDIGADQGHGVRVVYGCRRGMMTVNELDGELLCSEREEQYRELPTTRYGMPAVNTRHAIRPADVIDTSAAVLTALLTDVDNVSGHDARRVVAALVAAYQSAEHNSGPVRLDGALDRTRVFPWA